MKIYIGILAFVLTALPVYSENSGAFVSAAKVLSKVVTAIENSRIDELTSKTFEDGNYSYHLKMVDYLGFLTRDKKQFVVATAFFIRSSAKNSHYPPARGHGFILLLDSAFQIVSHARLDFQNYHLDGDVLMLGDTAVIDFADKDIRTRHHGWLADGGFLPYPFADKISDDEWEKGLFRHKNSEGSKPR